MTFIIYTSYYTKPSIVIIISIIFIAINGAIIPPRPYTKRFLDNNLLAGTSLYFTPFNANGISVL